MSNEDKMREGFYKAFPKFAGILEMADADSISHLDSMTARHQFAVWKACAAIKDAEIAAHRATALKMQAEIDRQVKIQADLVAIQRKKEEEIAARDLMIKELRETLILNRLELDRLPHSLGYEFTHIPKIDKALANSEHHDYRALEKMLLEARIDELEAYTTGRFFLVDRMKEHKAKLAELNKE